MSPLPDPATLFWLAEPGLDWRARIETTLAEDPTGRALRGLASCRLDIARLRMVATRIARAAAAGASLSALRPLRLGLIGAGTLDFLATALPGTAPRFGLRLEVAPVEYNAIALPPFGTMGLDGPLDVVAILPGVQNLRPPAQLLDPAAHQAAVDRALADIERVADAMQQAFGCDLVLATVPGDAELALSDADASVPGAMVRFLADLNARIAALAAARGAGLLDLARTAAMVGTLRWADPLSRHVAKSPFAVDLAALVADRLCAVLAGLAGKSRRALVLDLDNTCWGGVIGDDGIEGITVGQGDATGEAFLAVQTYALRLRERGVVLCVCSKNDDAVARAPFREHPDMLLREEHIAVFQANWSDKATNLQSIAEQLSLGLDALVFLDDNPAERARVRQMLPEVAVPELPDDPAYYARCLAMGGWFENARLNPEDLARAAAYRGNAERARIRETIGSYDDYLAALAMVLTVGPFDPVSRGRVAQLIAKSNQFNLTTRRRSEAQVREVEEAADHVGLHFRLADTFGDNGIIAVAILRLEGVDAVIDTWLMSCRVLERGVEKAVLNELARAAAERGASRLLGEYAPSPRNGMVRDHYAGLGFAPVAGPEGSDWWSLDLAGFAPATVAMAVVRA